MKIPSSFIKYELPRSDSNAGDTRATTKALGEEGGTKPPPDVTTMAVGEEGGTKPPSKDDPILTTMAVGEEGGSSAK